MSSKNHVSKTYAFAFTDEDLKSVYAEMYADGWKTVDSATVEDRLKFRQLLGALTEQDLNAVCLIWLMNRVILLRKSGYLADVGERRRSNGKKIQAGAQERPESSNVPF